VRERLRFRNHRTGLEATVTVSAAVVAWSPGSGITDPERVTADAEAALRRASASGGNRVEVVAYASRSS
jgi:hypothetical protein